MQVDIDARAERYLVLERLGNLGLSAPGQPVAAPANVFVSNAWDKRTAAAFEQGEKVCSLADRSVRNSLREVLARFLESDLVSRGEAKP